MWVVMKQGLRIRERVIIIVCDSGGLTAGSGLAPVLVLQARLTHTCVCMEMCACAKTRGGGKRFDY